MNTECLDTKKLYDIAEELGWTVTEDEEYVDFQKYTDAGEDFSFDVHTDRIVDGVKEYADSFDEDEHIAMWIMAKEQGVSGVPATKELVRDAERIKKSLLELATALARGKVPGEYDGRDLAMILSKHFGCKRPFYKTPVVKERFGYGFCSYRYITVAGDKAYGKLVDLVYDLGKLLPDVVDADGIIECLDDIVDGYEP